MRSAGLRAMSAVTLVLSAFAVGGCTAEDRVGEPAPALAGEDFAGEHWDLAELTGSVVLVAVWASWCAPCRDEVPLLTEAQSEFADDGLVVLGVNFRDHPDAARSFLEQLGAGYPSIIDRDGAIGVEWGVTGLPQSFLVDRDGRLVDRIVGPVTTDWLEESVVPEVLG